VYVCSIVRMFELRRLYNDEWWPLQSLLGAPILQALQTSPRQSLLRRGQHLSSMFSVSLSSSSSSNPFDLYCNAGFISCVVYLFQACARKRKTPHCTRAVDEVVTEVRLPTSSTDTSFEHFLERNRDDVNRAIDDHYRRYGYITLFYII